LTLVAPTPRVTAIVPAVALTDAFGAAGATLSNEYARTAVAADRLPAASAALKLIGDLTYSTLPGFGVMVTALRAPSVLVSTLNFEVISVLPAYNLIVAASFSIFAVITPLAIAASDVGAATGALLSQV